MNRKGQLTVLVIIALVVVAGIGAYLYVSKGKIAEQSPEVKDVSGFVSGCLDSVSRDAVSYVGGRGGYYEKKNDSNEYFYYPIPYYMDKSSAGFPAQSLVEKSISQYVDENLFYCLIDLTQIESMGYNVTFKSSSTTSKITGNKVLVTSKIPVVIVKGDSVSELGQFSSTVTPVRLSVIFGAVDELLNSEAKHGDRMCVTCINSIIESFGLRVRVWDTDNRNEFIFNVIDEQSNFTGSAYQYNFAMRYNFPNCVGDACAGEYK